MKTPGPTRSRARRIVAELTRLYPDARCSLDFASPFQLLVATILSAQCTDARVNRVTPALFARFPDAEHMARADLAEVESLIQSTGFFHNKARNILACSQQLLDRHQGHVPGTMDELVQLAGVGRKTANVILGNAFDVPGLPVDTHVTRLAKRLGLTTSTDPKRIEEELTAIVAKKEWTRFGLRLIFHGREVCLARSPHCDACTLTRMCPKVDTQKSKSRTSDEDQVALQQNASRSAG
jgi:endonuclease-3